MDQERRTVQYLPSWKVRQSIWLEKITLEVQQKCYVERKIDESLCKGIEDIYIDAGLTAPEFKTLKKWLHLLTPPRGNKLNDLNIASPLSGKWLKTDYYDEPLHYFLNAIDYYVCSIQPERKPTLFSHEEQNNFAKRYLNQIAIRWNISSVSEDNGNSLRKKVQDASLSRLQTHGHSAIPFYLSCIASYGYISESESLDWYLDLMCSTLIVSANLFRKNISFDLGYPSQYPDMVEYFGTCPNLLGAIGTFLLKPATSAEYLFKDASSYGNFDEVLDCEILLKWIMSGNIMLQEELYNLGGNYEQVISTFHTRGIPSIFLPEVHKDQINLNKNYSFTEPNNLESNDLIIFHLIPSDSTNPTRVVKIVNGSSPELIACRFLKKARDDHYSWGYGGTGVTNMAYTLLYELFNHNKSGRDKFIPNDSQIELLVYKLLSRLYCCFQYSITSEQILDALKEPIVQKEKKPPKLGITLEDFIFVE